MIRHREKYTFMRKNILTGMVEEGISHDDIRVMNNLLRAAAIEDVGWICWVRENKVGMTQYNEVFLG